MVHVQSHVLVNMQFNNLIILVVNHVHIIINKDQFIVQKNVQHPTNIIIHLMEKLNVLLHVMVRNTNMFKEIIVSKNVTMKMIMLYGKVIIYVMILVIGM